MLKRQNVASLHRICANRLRRRARSPFFLYAFMLCERKSNFRKGAHRSCVPHMRDAPNRPTRASWPQILPDIQSRRNERSHQGFFFKKLIFNWSLKLENRVRYLHWTAHSLNRGDSFLLCSRWYRYCNLNEKKTIQNAHLSYVFVFFVYNIFRIRRS